MIYTKIFKRILRRLVFKFIFRNLYIYELGIFIARYTNFLLPHEEDIYGINFLNLEKKREIIDVGASDGLYFRSVKFIGVNSFGKKVTNKVGMHDSMIVVFKEKKWHLN